MRATKTITWTTKTGTQVEVNIEIIHEVQTETAYADGYNVDLGKKTVDMITIEVKVDGRFKTRSYHAPQVLDPKFYKDYEKLTAAGAYARLGDVYISKEQYEQIMAAINEINATETSDEYKTVKTEEIKKEQIQEAADNAEAARYAQQIKNGLCPKCGTYCWGDCEAN